MDCTILSFHPVKHITTGEGGAILTNNSEIATHIRKLRSGGITHDSEEFLSEWSLDESNIAHPWAYEMHHLGYNYRLTDFQCALGITQLKKLSHYVALRQEIAFEYDKAFSTNDRIKPLYNFTERSVYHLYVLQADFTKSKIDRSLFFRKMRESGIGLQLHYIPIPYQPYYQKLNLEKYPLPMMDKYFAQSFSIPIYPALTRCDQNRVIEAILENLV